MFSLRNKKDINSFRMKKVPYLLLCKLTKYENKKDFCFAKMFVIMVAMLIFERAVMFVVFTCSPVL